jgi:hypothetical protein
MTPEEIAAQEAADKAAALARGDILNADEEAEKLEADNLDADKAAKEAAEKEAAELAAKAAKDDENLETDEEKVEREAAEAAEANKKRVRIPLTRHEEILAKAKAREEALAARVAELERKTEAPKKDVLGELKTSIETLQDKYEELLFEGKKDEAKAVRKEMDAARERYTDAKVAAVGQAARASTIDQLKYEAALAKAESDYPVLNPDTDSFDEDKATEVSDLLQMFQGRGLTRQAALEKAVKYVLGAPAAKAEARKDDSAQVLAEKRAAEARAKAADAAKRQAPDASKAGMDNDKMGGKDPAGINVMKMTQAQFDKLDEETLAKIRGDVV